MTPHLARSALALAVAVAACLAGFGACASYDPSAVTLATCPPFDDPATPFEDFRTVSSVLERRCATIDCHGSSARPLRLYGQSTLRRPEDAGAADGIDLSQYFPGGNVATTDAELRDNYRSLCGLEPEIMSSVVQGAQPVESLTLVRKPRLLEKHKGGRVWFEGDLGDRCLTSWLHGAVDKIACDSELVRP